MILFAFGHRRYVGKDTAARFLINHIRLEHNLHVKKISFATRLKDICFDMFQTYGLKSGNYYENHPEQKDVVIPKLSKSARDTWIKVGNDLREVHSDIWIDLAFEELSEQVNIITDLRYWNEAKAIKRKGGTLIRIDRVEVTKHTDVADTALDFFEDWDYIIQNNDSLSDFYKAVTTIVDEVLDVRRFA